MWVLRPRTVLREPSARREPFLRRFLRVSLLSLALSSLVVAVSLVAACVAASRAFGRSFADLVV